MTAIKLTTPRVIGSILLIVGISLLGIAIAYSASVPALIGLGLIFWGLILTYIQTEEYTRKTLLDAITASLLAMAYHTLLELDYHGKAIYLPPKYLNEPESVKAYLPKQLDARPPTPEQTQRLEKQPSQRDAQAILITPPGADLTKLFEQTSKASFIRKTLQDLTADLPKLIIEDLELATDFQIQPSAETNTKKTVNTGKAERENLNRISVKITTDIYQNTWKQIQQQPLVCANIGCPLTSAIASTLAKATGKPVIIDKQQFSEDGKTTETEYLILEDET